MKYFSLVLMLTSLMACSQQSISKKQQALLDKAKKAQYELNIQYADKEKSPLTDADFKTFRSLDFYLINLKYIVKADFVKKRISCSF